MRTVIRVSCIDQQLKAVASPLLASGGMNEAVVAFDFCEKWDGFAKTGVFYRDEEDVYYSLLDENDECIIPHEVYDEPGTFYFTVFGDKDDIRRTASTLRYKAYKGVVGDAMKPSDPTPDVYDQIMSMIAGGTGGGSGGNIVVDTSVEPAEDDIPKIFFGGALQQTKDEKVVPFRYISKTDDFSGYAEIKAQGNSSMNYAKKNQTVKMFKDEACESKMKVDFKGWGKQNKHVYKANWIDLSHSRNVVSARLWADVVKSRSNYEALPELLRTSPNQGAVDGFPVKVYAAGVYQGRYTLNIPKDKWTFNMDDELAEHCVLCGENYVSGCFRASAKIDESDWTDEIHDTVPTSVKTRWNEVISFVMNSTDDDFRANLGQYFFVDSLIDYYLFGLASCGLDAFGKNQIYATYDGQRWIASMYDMDSTWGLYWNGSKMVATDYARTSYEDMVSGRQGNLLYMRLEQLFPSELKARWEELKNGALSIENIINRFERFTDIAPLDLVKEDYASTTGGGKFTGIPSKDTNNIQQIRSFAMARQAWTDSYVSALSDSGTEEPDPDVPVDPEPHDHSYTSEVTTAATCTTDGVRTYTCSCGHSYTEVIPSTGHNYVNGVCTVCGVTDSVSCTGVTLSANTMSFIGGGLSQILTATVVPSNTKDTVSWQSSDPNVVSVDAEGNSCVVRSISAGEATITATCGGHSANCAVQVGAYTPAYSLPQATTFTGAETQGIDTGVKLFDEKKDFTVLIEWEHTSNAFQSNTGVIMHCMHEVSPWPGMALSYNQNGLQQEIIQNKSLSRASLKDDGITNANFRTLRTAYKIDWSTGTASIARRYNGEGGIKRDSDTLTYTRIAESTLLGCYQDSNGTRGRFVKGILRECNIYDFAMTDDAIDSWLNGNSATLNPVFATSIALDKTSLTFTGKDSQRLTATVLPSDATVPIYWQSSNNLVAVVENGTVTPRSDGICTITATCGRYSATCSVEVNMAKTAVVDLDFTADEAPNIDGVLAFSGSGTHEIANGALTMNCNGGTASYRMTLPSVNTMDMGTLVLEAILTSVNSHAGTGVSIHLSSGDQIASFNIDNESGSPNLYHYPDNVRTLLCPMELGTLYSFECAFNKYAGYSILLNGQKLVENATPKTDTASTGINAIDCTWNGSGLKIQKLQILTSQ